VGDPFFLLKNDKNEIIIDDQYKNPTFLFKDSVVANEQSPTTDLLVGGKYLPYRGYGISVLYAENKYETESVPLGEFSRTFYFGRSRSGASFEVSTTTIYDSQNVAIGFKTMAYSSVQNDVVDIAVFHLGRRKASDMGLVLWNKGVVVFDALKGFLQVIDSINITVNLYGGVQAFKLHDSAKTIPFEKIYVCSTIGLRPFLVRGGTIVINYRAYAMSLENRTDGVYLLLSPYGGAASGASVINQMDKFSALIAYVPY